MTATQNLVYKIDLEFSFNLMQKYYYKCYQYILSENLKI